MIPHLLGSGQQPGRRGVSATIKGMIQAVIFDMDGLLIDSEPLWARVYQEVFEPLGVAITDKDMIAIRGRLQIEGVEYFYHKYGWEGRSPEDIVAALYAGMVRMIKREARLLPGARHTLELCRQTGLPLALASSSPMILIDAVMAKLKIRDFFDHIYSAEHEPYGKPHPGVFITTANLLDVPAALCVVFEDAPGGVLAAKAAKMHCIAVPEAAFKTHPFIRTADIVLDSLEAFDAAMLSKL